MNTPTQDARILNQLNIKGSFIQGKNAELIEKSGRVVTYKKEGCEMVLVDGKISYILVEGEEIDTRDAETNNEWISFFTV